MSTFTEKWRMIMMLPAITVWLSSFKVDGYGSFSSYEIFQKSERISAMAERRMMGLDFHER